MSANRKPGRKLDRSSCHYLSTPLLNKVGDGGDRIKASSGHFINQANSANFIQSNSDHYDPGLNYRANTGRCNRFKQGLSPQRESDIADWVEQTTRFSVTSSFTDVSSSGTFSSDSTRCSPSRDVHLRIEDTILLQNIHNTYRTQNWIGGSLVNLYNSLKYEAWTLRATGVPILILDQGGSRSRERGVRIVVAERESGLSLWTDRLDNLSSYAATETTFHTFHCSEDHTTRIGLSWDAPSDAINFINQVNLLLSVPENIGLSGPKGKHKVKSKSGSKSGSKPGPWRGSKLNKSDISRPVGFNHTVSLTLDTLASQFSSLGTA